MQIVETPAQLEETRQLVSRSPWSAVDTEADSLHHYVEKLCLVQVSIPGHDLVIDPLAEGMNLTEFIRTIFSKPLLLHGADFDIRMLKRASGGLMPEKGIFDTVIAAQLLGYEHQGLADLVEKHFQIKLSKSSQKADWSRRPLTETLLDYAINDTKHLKGLSDLLTEELSSLGRLEWHRQFCARLVRSLAEPKADRVQAETAWQVKGSKELKGKGLAYLKALWYWRENEAKRKDRPTFKVIHSELLVKIAAWAVENPSKDVAELPNAPRNIKGEYHDALNAVLAEALHHAELRFTHKPREYSPRKWTEKQNQRLLRLKTERESLAKELKLHPSLLATNAILEVIAYEPPADKEAVRQIEILMPWQAEVLANSILEACKE